MGLEKGPMKLNLSDRNLGLLFAWITALCWAVLAIGLKYALTFTTTDNIAAIRVLLAFVGLFGYYLFFNQKALYSLTQKFPWWALLGGTFLAFNYFGFMKGVELTGASNSQIMIQLGPLTLALAGVFIFKETFTRQQFFSVLLALLGFALFYYDQTHLAQALSISSGNLWLLMAALTWTCYAVIQKQLAQYWNPQVLNLVVFGMCSLLLCLNANLIQTLTLSPWQWFILSLLGLNTLVGYGCLAEALKRARASRVSLIITVNPLGTLGLIYLGNLFTLDWIPHESSSWIGWTGALLVVTGVSWTLIRKKS